METQKDACFFPEKAFFPVQLQKCRFFLSGNAQKKHRFHPSRQEFHAYCHLSGCAMRTQSWGKSETPSGNSEVWPTFGRERERELYGREWNHLYVVYDGHRVIIICLLKNNHVRKNCQNIFRNHDVVAFWHTRKYKVYISYSTLAVEV